MTQAQIDLHNAAEAALNEAQSKIAELRRISNLGELLEQEMQIDQEAVSQTIIYIKTALLWLRET